LERALCIQHPKCLILLPTSYFSFLGTSCVYSTLFSSPASRKAKKGAFRRRIHSLRVCQLWLPKVRSLLPRSLFSARRVRGLTNPIAYHIKQTVLAAVMAEKQPTSVEKETTAPRNHASDTEKETAVPAAEVATKDRRKSHMSIEDPSLPTSSSRNSISTESDHERYSHESRVRNRPLTPQLSRTSSTGWYTHGLGP